MRRRVPPHGTGLNETSETLIARRTGGGRRTFLRDWYGLQYQPRVRPENAVQIDILERAQPGADFNHAFYEVFARDHHQARLVIAR